MEILDICDENGMPSGDTVERETAHAEGVLHRTAHVWILRNTEGKTEVLLQKRSQNKDSFPGMFDTSSAGHIPAGCEPEESALRELQEELGITAEKEDLLYIGMFRNQYEEEFRGKPFRDNEVTFVYLLQMDVRDAEIRLQKEEVECTEWFDTEETYAECLKGTSRFCMNPAGMKVLMDYLHTCHEEGAGCILKPLHKKTV